jgi:hypothetical protein
VAADGAGVTLGMIDAVGDGFGEELDRAVGSAVADGELVAGVLGVGELVVGLDDAVAGGVGDALPGEAVAVAVAVGVGLAVALP